MQTKNDEIIALRKIQRDAIEYVMMGHANCRGALLCCSDNFHEELLIEGEQGEHTIDRDA